MAGLVPDEVAGLATRRDDPPPEPAVQRMQGPPDEAACHLQLADQQGPERGESGDDDQQDDACRYEQYLSRNRDLGKHGLRWGGDRVDDVVGTGAAATRRGWRVRNP